MKICLWDVSLNLETDDNHWVPGDENMVGGTFLSKPIQVQQSVQNVTMHRCVVMQNYGYLCQLSLALLFTCDKQFAK